MRIVDASKWLAAFAQDSIVRAHLVREDADVELPEFGLLKLKSAEIMELSRLVIG
jgi:hypothetical protein